MFHVDSHILSMFNKSVICGVLKNCLVCWGGNVQQKDKMRIDAIIRRAGRVIGECQPTVDTGYQGALRIHGCIWDDSSHPLHQEFASAIIPRSGRMRPPAGHTNRHKNSFVPKAIKLYNESIKESR